MVFRVNVVGTPGDYEGNCGDGRRVFVERNANNNKIVWFGDNQFRVVWCDATGDDGPAEIKVDRDGGLAGDYVVYIRILGKPGGSLDVCANGLGDPDYVEDGLCELGEIHLNREGGKSTFNFAPQIWDNEYEDVLWDLDTNQDFRIAELRVYEAA
jgi:hypothetical protein